MHACAPASIQLRLLHTERGSEGQDEEGEEQQGSCRTSVASVVALGSQGLRDMRQHVGTVDDDVSRSHVDLQ